MGWLQTRGTQSAAGVSGGRPEHGDLALSAARTASTTSPYSRGLQAHAAVRARFRVSTAAHRCSPAKASSSNHKRVHRVYRAAGLQVRRRRRKRLTRAERLPLPMPSRRASAGRWILWPTRWPMVATFRTLNIVDDFTRECVAIEVDRSLPGARVVRVLERLHAVGRSAADDRRGQRAGVCGPHARRVGLCPWRHASLHSPRQADRERVRRELQRQVSGRMPQRALVCQPGRCDRRRSKRGGIDYNTVRPHSSLGRHAATICQDLGGGSPAVAGSP